MFNYKIVDKDELFLFWLQLSVGISQFLGLDKYSNSLKVWNIYEFTTALKKSGRIHLSRKMQNIELSMYNTSNDMTRNNSMYCTSNSEMWHLSLKMQYIHSI